MVLMVSPTALLADPAAPSKTREEAAAKAKAARVAFDKAQANAPKLMIAVEPAKKVEATLQYSYDAPDLTAVDWVVYAPKPPSHPSQKLLQLDMRPMPKEVSDLAWADRHVLAARVAGGKSDSMHHLDVTVGYRLQLFKRDLMPAEGNKPAAKVTLSRAERDESLNPTETLDFDTAAFGQWLDKEKLRPNPDETEVDFARRAFLQLKGEFEYLYTGSMDRHSSKVCRAGKSDCGGLNGMLVSVLRASGIPARLLVGRWAESSKDGDSLGNLPYYQTHVKGEFFLTNVGWVPIDLSSALGDKSKEGLRFFGHDGGNFVAMHLDPDLQLDTIHFGHQTIQWLQGPTFWVTGGGKMESSKTTDKWVVKELETTAAAGKEAAAKKTGGLRSAAN
jgi:hypothetical protein